MTEVRTRDEAIASVDRALQVWSTNMVGVLTQGQATARAAKDEIERIARRYANEVAAMEALLGAADDEERRQLQAKLVRVREASEKAERARERVGQVEASVARLNRTHVTAATSLVSSARAQLSAMRRALDGYRSGGADLGGAGSHGGNGGCAGPTSLAGTGLTDVNVSSADLDDNPILDDGGRQGTFGKGGLTRADYRWAVQTTRWAPVSQRESRGMTSPCGTRSQAPSRCAGWPMSTTCFSAPTPSGSTFSPAAP
jgi:hypothetical protein